MYYNKIPFREVGLDPEQPPKDLDEARAASEKLVQRDPAGNVTRYGFALDIAPWYVELTLAGAGELYVNNDNGRAGVATEVAFDNEAGQKLFQWWHDMVHDGLMLNVGWDPTGANALLAVGARKAVMVLSTSAAMRSIVDVLARGLEGVDLGVAPVPGIPGKVPEGSPGVYSRSLSIMSARPQAERDAAWKFIKWLDGARTAGRMVRRQRLPACPQLRLRLAGRKGHYRQVPAVPDPGRPVYEDGDNNRRPGTAPRPLPAGTERCDELRSRACSPEAPARTKRWQPRSSRPTRPSATTTAVWAIKRALRQACQVRNRLGP